MHRPVSKSSSLHLLAGRQDSPVLGGFLLTFIQSKVCAGEDVSETGERQASWWLAWRGDKELLYVARARLWCSCPYEW